MGVDLFFGGLVVAIGLVDLYAVVVNTPKTARTSWRAYGWRLSGCPFALGMLGGRLCPAVISVDPIGVGYAGAVLLFVGVFGAVVGFHALLRWGLDLPSWFSLLYLPGGVVAQAYLWPV